MDTLKEFWHEFKERISSPFFASFVISWLIFNYPIVIGILFYKQTELKADGYVSYLDLINQTYDINKMLYYPLIASLVYCIIFKELLRIIQTRISAWSTRFILWMTDESVVSAAVHRASESTLRTKIAEYAQSIELEGEAKKEVGNLNSRITTLTADYDLKIKHLNEENDLRITQLNDQANERVTEIQKAELLLRVEMQKELGSKASEFELMKADLETANSMVMRFKRDLGDRDRDFRDKQYKINDLELNISNLEVQLLKAHNKNTADVVEVRLIHKDKISSLEPGQEIFYKEYGWGKVIELLPEALSAVVQFVNGKLVLGPSSKTIYVRV